MKVAVFDTHRFEKSYFEEANRDFHHEITFFEPRLTALTAPLAHGFDCACCFVNDVLDAETLRILKREGIRLIALRSAGYNNVDLEEGYRQDLKVVRVPAYSPHAVAEHAVGLLLSLNRKIHKAYARTHEMNFSLDGLVGFDVYKKTIGIIGTGKIGAIFAKIMKGFDCRVLAYDPNPNSELNAKDIVQYVALEELYRSSDIISLHTPLTPDTYHLINAEALSKIKRGSILINTGRGALIDTRALIDALKSEHIGGAALDVYEEEEGIFFKDLSEKVIQDDILTRLIMFPNVLLTSHQGFLTGEALTAIAKITLQNIADFEKGVPLKNEVRAETHVREKESFIMEKKTKTSVKDPVCGMEVDPLSPGDQFQYEGVKYFFCSSHCKRQFIAGPTGYLQFGKITEIASVKPFSQEKTQKIVYTCPMHPEILSDKPGLCPKCGMALESRRRAA